MKPLRVVALGQRVAGDDGVALQVLQRLQERQAETPQTVELVAATDSSQLIDLFRHQAPVWVLDAVVGAGPPGRVLELRSEDLAAEASCSVSSHGLDAIEALDLCRTLYPESVCPEVRIFAVSIDSPRRYEQRLSAPVAAAVEECLALVSERLALFNTGRVS